MKHGLSTSNRTTYKTVPNIKLGGVFNNFLKNLFNLQSLIINN